MGRAATLRPLRVAWALGSLCIRIFWNILAVRLGRLSQDQRDRRIGAALASYLSRLAGVYIKFGQMLAMRADVFPEPVIRELSFLYDRVEPEPFQVSRRTLEDEWGEDQISQRLVMLDETPLAAGSFATVYRGRLDDDRPVAIKVRRRDLEQLIIADLRIVRRASWLVDATGLLRRFRLRDLVADFERWTNEELDYNREARHMAYFRQLNAGVNSIRAPDIVWPLTTARVLVMELFEGDWLSDIIDRPEEEVRRRSAAKTIFASSLRQIFEFGFFHADPHPGNFCLMRDGGIGLIDFGIIGYSTDETRAAQLQLLSAIQRNDMDDAFRGITRVLNIPPDADLRRFHDMFEENVREWQLRQYQPNLSAIERSGAQLLMGNFRAARACGIYFKTAAIRYYRTFIILDGLVAALDPYFDQRAALGQYFEDRFIRSRVQLILKGVSGLDLQMTLSDRLSRWISGIDELLKFAGPSDLLQSVFDNGLLRASRISSAFARLSFALSALAVLIGVGAKFGLHPPLAAATWPWLVDAFAAISHHAGSSAAFLFGVGFVLTWFSRQLWINSYTRDQYTPVSGIRPGEARHR